MTGRPNAARSHRASDRRRSRAAVTLALLALAAAVLCLLAGHGLPGRSDSAVTSVAVDGETRSETPEATADASVPESGPGTFTVATTHAHRTGAGRPYRVEVEDDTGVDADEAAEQIAAILDDERGWAHGAGVTFRQVADDSATLVIRIATPDTADAICATGGLDTEGELNCRVGRTVAVNLKRWQLGSPEFAGPPEEYRALIINHEVGHWLGYDHRDCPGPGRPAPVMMQQIKGLHGCVSNAWPYAADGSFLDGPKVP
ncbi:DUF3152 domain-containing protein [Streptomyces sp. NPDC097595]|uniref:DUF3152 domain-containing protein n=1 Tax=Streptomyces sp. NPDC097595 TaxID=3366090 RepID=UPI0038073B13